VRERRKARIGTVSGLALLAGGTAVAAVAGGAHSVFATILLGLLALGMGHALLVEIRRQARRSTPGGWTRADTINAVLLACWAEAALILTILEAGPVPVRVVGGLLAAAYTASCAYFVTQRRRALASRATDRPDGAEASDDRLPARPHL
jgi:peptidoglycan/LPS O-acetylase OafA/YrhL